MKKIVKSIIILLMTIVLMVSFMPTKPVLAAKFLEPEDGKVYLIRNVGTGKYLNVNFGTDSNGTNVNQWEYDGSIEQKWKFKDLGARKFMLYAMCSSNGTDKVLDVLRVGGSSSGAIVSGCNVDIWTDNDSQAQTWEYYYEMGGYLRIILASNDNLALSAYGTGNGSGAGTSSTSNGNVLVMDINNTYEPGNVYHSLWEFIPVD